jgi:hypothetical protein
MWTLEQKMAFENNLNLTSAPHVEVSIRISRKNISIISEGQASDKSWLVIALQKYQ